MSDRTPSPELGGAVEAFLHERASATPGAHAHRGRERDARGAAPPLPRDASLRALEEWMRAAIMAPVGSDRLDADAARVLTPGPQLEAAGRLGIYREGYLARLVECLVDDYPALEHALGEEAFESLCHEYIDRHPSTGPNLNVYGRHMERFCREEARELPERGFAADLAALEWALVEVLHAKVAERLSPQELGAIPTQRWTEARLPKGDAVRVLRSAYPANVYFQAFKQEAPVPIPGPSPSATAVYRTDATLWRMDLTPAMATLLESLFGGETLGGALERLGEGLGEDEVAEAERSVMIWFREWVAAGFFARVDLG